MQVGLARVIGFGAWLVTYNPPAEARLARPLPTPFAATEILVDSAGAPRKASDLPEDGLAFIEPLI